MAAMAAVPDTSILTPEYIAFTNAPALLNKFGALFGAASIVVLLRCHVRAVMLRSFGKDDWLILLAYAFSAATFGVYISQTQVGMGKHFAAVITSNREHYQKFLRLRQAGSILASFGVALVKIAIAYFLLRLVVHRGYVHFLHGLNIFMLLVTFACVGTLIWQFVPVEAVWNLELRPPPFGHGTAKCFSAETLTDIGLFNTVTTIITEFMVALMPVPLVWQLQLNLRAKISLMFVLTLRIFAAISAIVKAEIQKTFFQDPDPYVEDRFTLWRNTEMDVGLIAASLPALKPLFNWFLGAARSLTTRAQRDLSSPATLGYHKQSENTDKGIALGAYNSSSANEAGISSKPKNGNMWSIGAAKNSDESILPLHNAEENPGTILVTRDVRVS